MTAFFYPIPSGALPGGRFLPRSGLRRDGPTGLREGSTARSRERMCERAPATGLRVEFLYVLTVLGLVVGVDRGRSRRRPDSLRGWGSLALAGSGLFVGGIVALAWIPWQFGFLLSDAAVAKSSVSVPWLRTLTDIARAHAASSAFGLGLALLAGIGWLRLLRRVRGAERAAVLLLGSSIPILWGLVVMANQQVQGMRYFVFHELFVASWCLLWLNRVETAMEETAADCGRLVPSGTSRCRLLWAGSSVLVGLALALIVADAVAFARLVEGRSRTYRVLRDADLSPLQDRLGVAWDVGMIGYFSGGQILDPNGLVNGRAFAMLPAGERLERIAREPVDFAFVNAEQQAALERVLPLEGWPLRLEVGFPNRGGDQDLHALRVRPEIDRSFR